MESLAHRFSLLSGFYCSIIKMTVPWVFTVPSGFDERRPIYGLQISLNSLMVEWLIKEIIAIILECYIIRIFIDRIFSNYC